ncbi:unnamed protein product [Parajaminaea phylloscopi]
MSALGIKALNIPPAYKGGTLTSSRTRVQAHAGQPKRQSVRPRYDALQPNLEQEAVLAEGGDPPRPHGGAQMRRAESYPQ